MARRGGAPSYLGPIKRGRTGGFSGRSPAQSKEINFLDTAVLGAIVSTTVSVASNTIQLLNGMAQGTTASTRLGRRIRIMSIQLRGRIFSAATTTVSKAAVCVVYDKQANAADPAWQDVWDNSTALGANSPFAMRNLSNADRFVVLWREEFDVLGNVTATAITDKGTHVIDHYRRCNLETHYNAGSAGTIGDIQTGSLYVMACSNVATGTAAPLLDLTTRIRFSD